MSSSASGSLLAAGERRRARRLEATACGIVRARLRPGQPAELIDLSAWGACLETLWRLVPGAQVDLHLERAGEAAVVRGRVLRCAIVIVLADRLRYRAGLRFHAEHAWLLDAISGGNDMTDFSSPAFTTQEASHDTSSLYLPRVQENVDPSEE